MPRRTDVPLLLALLALPGALEEGAGALAAQSGEVELHVGRWWSGGRAASYELRTSAPLGGAFTHGLSLLAVVHDSLGRNRAFYGLGYELQVYRRRGTFGPYVLMGAVLGLSTDTADQQLGVHWSLGGGVEWRPLSRLALGGEGRYRVEDRGPRGFWRPRDPRKGLSLAAGVTLRVGRAARIGRRAPVAPAPPPATYPPLALPPSPSYRISGNAADVVRTALDALGSPYRWGGTAENGFDCSGLIQYAYGQYGIRLPRTSGDQAHSGSEVSPVIEALQPGDILLFSARPGGGVTHVGMYVGEGRFIHSSNTGVKLSRLDPHDPEAVWWLPRWVGVRRVIP
ncbi:MAG: C40 family peptidase [Gemmatimonadales bacterium]